MEPRQRADAEENSYFADGFTVSNREFFPIVKDGFKDTVTISTYDALDYSDVTATVYSSRGSQVRQLSGRSKCADEDCEESVLSFTWNGKKANGKKAAKGKYRVVLRGPRRSVAPTTAGSSSPSWRRSR
ncbi:hypothetical protein [Aeromicrobium sp. UC242_57]|uniref:hypothetical protein n=1 Tax=Aeromicrobium sp. UC242_57 TaxID=3374624 RepID=UPI0037A182A8